MRRRLRRTCTRSSRRCDRGFAADAPRLRPVRRRLRPHRHVHRGARTALTGPRSATRRQRDGRGPHAVEQHGEVAAPVPARGVGLHRTVASDVAAVVASAITTATATSRGSSSGRTRPAARPGRAAGPAVQYRSTMPTSIAPASWASATHVTVRRERRHARLERAPRVAPRVVGLDRGGRFDLGGEHVRDDGADELVAVAEPPVHRGDADPGPPRDLVERHRRRRAPRRPGRRPSTMRSWLRAASMRRPLPCPCRHPGASVTGAHGAAGRPESLVEQAQRSRRAQRHGPRGGVGVLRRAPRSPAPRCRRRPGRTRRAR